MINSLKVFTNKTFGEIRMIEEDNKVLFCGSDVAKALGYTNGRKAASDHCRCITKRYIPHPQSLDKRIEVNFITEGDVYRLITHSKLPSAEKFESCEVLPSIRQHGMYATEELINNPDLAIAAFTALKEERQKRTALEIKVEQDKPKVLFANAVETAKTSILIGDLAKILKQNGVETGQKRLFEQLRQEGFLMKRGTSHNMPTQRSMEMGLFEVRESTINNPDGSVRINRTTKVTGKGQTFFVNKYLTGKSERVAENV